MSARIEERGDRPIVWKGTGATRGALTPEVYETCAEAMTLAVGPRIRAVILTSEGRFCCAGGDLNVLTERRKLTEEVRRERVDALHDLVRAMRACPVPIIAAIEGGAAGAGLSLALACDMIVACEEAQFTAAYVKAGLVPDAGLTASLARLLPRPLAAEMCLLGRPVMAMRFAELGAVNRICANGKALDEALMLADTLAAGPREAQGVIRQLVAQAYEANEADQLDAERDAMARAAGGDEAAEGIAAFLEKRKPRF